MSRSPEPAPVAPWLNADEDRHEGAGAEEWTFSFWSPDGSSGGLVLVRLLPALRRAWYWAAWATLRAPLVHVTDFEVALPARGLALRADGLWADHTCESPFEQWTVANETSAVAFDDPEEALGRGYGTQAAVAFDVEWYAAAAPQPVPSGYEQVGEVHGVVELATGSFTLDGAPAHRTHRWGAELTAVPVLAAPVLAHLGPRAPVRLPDGTVVDLVLTSDGWRTRGPR